MLTTSLSPWDATTRLQDCHPDRHPDSPDAEERFKTLCAALKKVRSLVSGEDAEDPEGMASWTYDEWKDFFASLFEG